MKHVSLSNPISFTLSLTIGVAIKLKELNLLDIFALPGSAEEFTRVISDEELFPKVLWQMTDQTCDFGTFKAMVLNSEQEPLWNSFRDELFAFFQCPIRQQVVALASAVNEKQSETPNRTQPLATTNEEQEDNAISSEAGTAYGNSEESVASILANFHTVSLST